MKGRDEGEGDGGMCVIVTQQETTSRLLRCHIKIVGSANAKLSSVSPIHWSGISSKSLFFSINSFLYTILLSE